MKKFLVSATTAAVLVAMSSGASAVVNLDNGIGSVNYASQLVTPGTTALTGAGANVVSTLGFGVSIGQTRFIRYDLTNAKFVGPVLALDLVVSNPGAAVVVSQGGQAGSTFVIFQITANGDVPQNATVSFASGSGGNNRNPAPPASPVVGLVIQAAGAPVQMSYSLYEDAPSAQLGGAAGRLNTNFGAQTVAGLVSGIAFTTAQNATTVDVAAATPYTRFIQGPAGTSTTVAQIGTVSVGAAANVLNPNTGNPVAYGEMVAAGTALVLKGDFGSAAAPSTVASGVFLGGDNNTCANAGTAPTPATPIDSASYATGQATVTNRPLCFTLGANNLTPIPTQDFTVELDVVPAVGSTATDLAPIAAGSFKRNGLVLKTAFAETTTAAGVNSAIHLNNTSARAVDFTVTCTLNVGSVPGKPGSLPAQTAQRFSLANGLGCPSNGTLRGVELTFATTPGSVIGSVVRQNTTTGLATFDNMVGNQANQ